MSRRFFANPLPPAGPATLSKKLGHHLGRIVRTSPGDSVVLFDGAGNEVAATIREVHSREVLVDVLLPIEKPAGRSPRIHLEVACALPRSARADWLESRLHSARSGGASVESVSVSDRTGRPANRKDTRSLWPRHGMRV